MDEQYRVQLGDPFHALAERLAVAMRKIVDPARAHECLESNDPPMNESPQLVHVAGHEAAPQPEVDHRRALGGLELEIERIHGGRHRRAVEGHVDEARVTARPRPSKSNRPRPSRTPPGYG